MDGERPAQLARRAGDHAGERGPGAVRGGVEDRAEDGPYRVAAAYRGDQDVEDSAAGQADGEGVVVAVAEAVDAALAGGERVEAELVDGGFHAASGDGAERGAPVVDGERGAGAARRAAADADHGGQCEFPARGAPRA